MGFFKTEIDKVTDLQNVYGEPKETDEQTKKQSRRSHMIQFSDLLQSYSNQFSGTRKRIDNKNNGTESKNKSGQVSFDKNAKAIQ